MTALRDLLATHPLEVADGDKGERGTLVLVGGPPTCPGAVVLAAEAALRSGSGRVQAIVHPEVAVSVAGAVPELFVMGWDPDTPLPDEVRRQLDRADAVVVGSGHSSGIDAAVQAVAAALPDAALVLDAGALEAAPGLADHRHLVLAPNAAEAARLAGREAPEDVLAAELARRFDGPVAVRGRRTVVATVDGQDWRTEGPAGLGAPGSGDVLIGVLGGLLARGLEPLPALAWAVALHERAGRLCHEDGPVGYLARDIGARLPAAYAEHLAPR